MLKVKKIPVRMGKKSRNPRRYREAFKCCCFLPVLLPRTRVTLMDKNSLSLSLSVSFGARTCAVFVLWPHLSSRTLTRPGMSMQQQE